MPRLLSVLFAFAALATFDGVAQAQQKKIVLSEVIDIRCKVQKPEITIFFSRQNLNPDYSLDLKESFIPKIVEGVDKKPF